MDVESVVELRKTGLPWAKIARHFGISRNSMYKFRRSHNIAEPNVNVTDGRLLITIIRQIHDSNPTCGAVLVRSHLLSMGIHVAEARVRAALRLVDPEGVQQRLGRRLYRRVYRVPGANYLFHIDGNHKLVMFNFVIHGCVDGHSRRVIFLNCSTNNRATTVLELFEAGVELFGIPHRVRGDRGCENGLVERFMFDFYGEDGRYLQGPSTHNTRIERLWRDVNEKITRPFKEIFISLEEANVLEETNTLDLFCLHFVFLFRIQRSLCDFLQYWNNHGLRTEGRKTPNQMWLMSMMSQYPHDRFNLRNLMYNFSLDSLTKNISDSSFISSVSENVAQVWLLESRVFLPDPLIDDGSYGRNHYVNLRDHLLLVSEELL